MCLLGQPIKQSCLIPWASRVPRDDRMIWGLVRGFGDFALESPHVVVAQVDVVAAAAAARNSSKTGFTSFKFSVDVQYYGQPRVRSAAKEHDAINI